MAAVAGAPHTGRRLAGRVAVLLAVTYLAITLLAMGLADRLIFFPPDSSYDGELPGLIRLPTYTGDTIAARLVGRAGAEVVVLFAHGNAEDVGHGRHHAARYADLGVAVMTFDYPGYGLSTGSVSEEGAYAAIDAVYDYLVTRGVSPDRIVAHGRSLGGAVAVDLASRREVGGLVIESSFVSAYRVMTRVPLLPLDQFASLGKLPDVSAPVLVVHGGRDAVIAEWHGRMLYDALPEDRRSALWVEGAGHNDLASVAGEAYWNALAEFVAAVSDAPH